MAGLTRAAHLGARALIFFALVLVALLATAPASLAEDPSPDPASTARPPTCSGRFPDAGPAGVDLRLGCIVSELVGLYTAGQAKPPPPLSSYAIVLGILTVGVVIVLWLVGRLLAQHAGRRLAPVLPGEWWVCATCRSVNGAAVEHCYSCGNTRADGPSLMTDERPRTPQSFGSKRKSG